MTTSQVTTLMLSQPLKVWEKIMIVVGDGADAGTYVGRIEDFADGVLVVTAPEYLSGKTLLRDDIPVVVQITRDDAIYQFDSHIFRHKAGGAEHVKLSAPRNFRRVQRRLFVRIQLREIIDFAPITMSTDWSLWPNCLTWHESVAHDISGGGVRITAPQPIEVNSVVLVRMRGCQLDALLGNVFAICRRAMRIDDEDQIGLEFISSDRIAKMVESITPGTVPTELRRFDRSAQNKLVVWVFHRQIELRQKGLL
jgi:c-di-GMP-binding flagellar brake protein YcgR